MAVKFKTEDRMSTVLGAVEEASSLVEELKDELQDWYDNLPESFQNGEKGDELQDTISSLEEAYDTLEEISGDTDAENPLLQYEYKYQQIVYPKSAYMSRQKRLEVGTCALLGAPTEIPDELEGSVEDGDGEMSDLLDKIQQVVDTIQSVSFPTR